VRDLNNLTVAVVGATGAVGREMLSTLAERAFPVKNLLALASSRSAGESVEFGDTSVTVQELTAAALNGVDIALFSAGGSVSAEFGPIAAEAGAVVIDNSSHFRMHEHVPLVVPEVNGQEVVAALQKRVQQIGPRAGAIIANPNCSTIQLVVVLKPLLDSAGLKRVVVSTYQSVSGAGQKGIEELWEQTLAVFNQQEMPKNVFPHPIAFNVLPQIDSFTDNGYTKEEMKVINESRKILAQPDLKITATAVRVPVFSCHAESVNVETARPLSPEDARELLMRSPGIIVLDNPGEMEYPLSSELAGTDATFVGRLRRDESVENGLNMWVVADNLRKGAALNAVQIAEIVLDHWGRESRSH